MLQDTHIHIQDIKNPGTIQSFSKEVFNFGFGRLYNCAITPADWPLVKSLAEQDERIVPFFGFHPWFSDLADEKSYQKLAEYLAWPKAFAGEMGIDKARKNIDFDLQKTVFAEQLKLAKKFNKPFVVHSVRAWAETIALIKQHASGLRFLMHSFNGSKEIADEIVSMGGYFSISVRQFLKTDDPFVTVFKGLPQDRILIETDFPYQVKWTNSADYVEAVRQGYVAAAAWRGVAAEELIRIVYDNGTIFTHRTTSGQV